MAATAMVHVRVEESIKADASAALADMGLTLSGAVNMFLTRVAVEKAIPFKVRIPNAATLAAMAETDAIMASGDLRFSDAESMFRSLETSGK